MTVPPAGEKVAFQPEVMVCPDGRVNVSAQPSTCVAPVSVTVICVVRPVLQVLVVYATRQVHAGVVGGSVGGSVGGRVVVESSPKNEVGTRGHAGGRQGVAGAPDADRLDGCLGAGAAVAGAGRRARRSA